MHTHQILLFAGALATTCCKKIDLQAWNSTFANQRIDAAAIPVSGSVDFQKRQYATWTDGAPEMEKVERDVGLEEAAYEVKLEKAKRQYATWTDGAPEMEKVERDVGIEEAA